MGKREGSIRYALKEDEVAPENLVVPAAADDLPETTNAVRAYHALDNEMMVLHHKGLRDSTEETDCAEAERIAKVKPNPNDDLHAFVLAIAIRRLVILNADPCFQMLLENADLPLVFRARDCIILGCSSEPGYVEWAEEGVRTVKMGIDYSKMEKAVGLLDRMKAEPPADAIFRTTNQMRRHKSC